MSSEAPYDPYIPAGSSGAPGGASAQQQNGNQRTAALQAVSPLPLPPIEAASSGIGDEHALLPSNDGCCVVPCRSLISGKRRPG